MPPHVLIVEDDRSTNSLLAEILRDAGFRVTSRTTAAEGLAHLHQAAPDLVIADYRLPDGVGTDICRVARRSGVPSIVVSGYPSSIHGAIEAEVDGWIAKPFEIDEVLRTVRRVLGPKSDRD